MSVQMRVVVALALVLVIVAVLTDPVSAVYRKPPFNGSIFGKRAGADPREYTVFEPGKGLASVCQVAVEACAAWFPVQEKK
ncbi:FMRFamide-related neuropeptides-like [Homarus americanus]|uniref:Val-1 SIFamide n=1 Tax=Homarus americanus TaxID=6706 RepID=A7Y330_HOMAM|nr:FMRFamide-related neuropeptides-like [Homarus americanus]ABV21807.1 Val-1 SIFamide [Homarus americanus]